MKKILVFILLIISLSAQATTYYVRTDGGNSHNGLANTSGGAWLTVTYAAAHATTFGDFIIVGSGTFDEGTNQIVLAAGVNLVGAGQASTTIISHYASTRGGGGISGAAIILSSGSQGTNGNQQLSGFTLDGENQTGTSDGSTAYVGILVFKRSNVRIHDCTIKNFYTGGVIFHGANVYDQPSTYATGNEIYNCILTDLCYDAEVWGGAGMIEIGGQDGLLIHDNTITQTGGNDYMGDVLVSVHYDKGVKYYNNKSYKPDVTRGDWNFHIEMWDTEGGFEIYNNEFHGGDNPIDIAGHFNLKGSYAYSWYIHDNLFISNCTTTAGKLAIQMEDADVEDVWIYRNHFTNWPCVINTTNGGNQPTQILKRIYIAYNIIENETWTWDSDGLYQNLFRLRCASNKGDFDGFYIYNNVIKGPTNAYTTAIKLEIESGSIINNMEIKNNIIVNHQNGTFFNVVNSGSISNLHVDYNVLYNNAGSDNPTFSGNSVSSYTFSNNIKSNPLLVSSSDFHLQAGSPGINAGTYVGLTSDYVNAVVNNPPEIGAYEYGSSGVVPMTAFTLSSAGNATTISTYHGTLQFSTSGITPSNTTDQTFNWSVTNGTGSGTITSGGLLSAVTNGTVTVRATAHDGSGITNTMVITLSNQTATGYPVIVTTIVTDVTPTTATLGGNVTSGGGLTVTNRGLCYGASINPTTSNTVIQTGTGTGTFVTTITGLTVGGTYHVRAFATNATGTSYGADVPVTTRSKYIVTY